MYKLAIASLLLLTSCSLPEWGEIEIQGVKSNTSRPSKVFKTPDTRFRFVGRFKFVGANIERGSGDLVSLKSCPRDSLFIEKNEFSGLSLSFREKGQYFYDHIYFINKRPPLIWIIEEELAATLYENKIIQVRKRSTGKGIKKLYIEFRTTLERVDDLLFYNSKVTSYRVNQLFQDELIPEYLGEIHCAYGFDSLTEEQKNAQVKDMGY